MQDRIELLELSLAQAKSRISPEAYIQWKASSSTKALLLQVELDLERLKASWVAGAFSDREEEIAAQASAQFLSDLPNVVREIGDKNED